MPIWPQRSAMRRRFMPPKCARAASRVKSNSIAPKSDLLEVQPPLRSAATNSLTSTTSHGRPDLALTPYQSDALIKEVDDAVRQDDMMSFWTRYGRMTIGAVVLALAAYGGWLLWQNHRANVAE